MAKIKKKRDWKRIVSILIFISFIAPLGFIIYKIFTAPTEATADIEYARLRSDYIIMLLQCLLGVVCMFLPGWISKKWSIEIPSNMYFAFIVFLYGAIVLGEVRDFYNVIPAWDTILHVFSGGMLGALGFSIVHLLNREHVLEMHLSPFFIALFAFTFAVTIGVFWEVYEFSADYFVGSNMQRHSHMDGTPKIGQEAVIDTMKDLIVDCAGAGAVSVAGYVSLKYKKGWLDRFLIKRGVKK